MRPVERGNAPKSYKKYTEAKDDLIQSLGRYCSYCERFLSVGLAVEHKKPKSKFPQLELSWNNFLLGCLNCNAIKGSKNVSDSETLWPDRDNTLLALKYSKDGFVGVDKNLPPSLQQRARKLVDLVKLDQHPGNKDHQKTLPNDLRWHDREKEWNLAEEALIQYEKNNVSLDFILRFISSRGFFSVWFTVFDEHPEFKKELIRKFPGTAQSCFDQNAALRRRPGGAI